jgi:biopolymer transport protein ExbD
VAKVRKKRVGFVIDMTPLVDITFLLLTFFMFTAKFKSEAESEQKFFIKRPTVSADTSKLPDKNLAMVKIAIDSVTKDTLFYYEALNDKDRASILQNVVQLNTQADKHQFFIGKDKELLSKVLNATCDANRNIIFAIDADRRIKYKWVDDVMEAIHQSEAHHLMAVRFKFVTEKKG